MSKFCENCGFKLDDDAMFCTNCGTRAGDERQNQKRRGGPAGPAGDEQGKKVGRIIKYIVIAAVVIAAAAISANVIYKFTGYRGLLRKAMKAYEEYDIEELVSMSSDVYYYCGEEYAENYFEDAVSAGLDELDACLGHNYKISYKTIDSYTVSGRKESMILDGIEMDFPDFDVDTIEKIVIAEVKVKGRKNNRTETLDLNVIMSKESGKWKLLELY